MAYHSYDALRDGDPPNVYEAVFNGPVFEGVRTFRFREDTIAGAKHHAAAIGRDYDTTVQTVKRLRELGRYDQI